jgi:hypothetical protein
MIANHLKPRKCLISFLTPERIFLPSITSLQQGIVYKNEWGKILTSLCQVRKFLDEKRHIDNNEYLTVLQSNVQNNQP